MVGIVLTDTIECVFRLPALSAERKVIQYQSGAAGSLFNGGRATSDFVLSFSVCRYLVCYLVFAYVLFLCKRIAGKADKLFYTECSFSGAQFINQTRHSVLSVCAGIVLVGLDKILLAASHKKCTNRAIAFLLVCIAVDVPELYRFQ